MTDNICRDKRIAFYIGGLCIGGAERVICNLAEYFLSLGYQVFMVTKERFDVEYELSPQITRIIADITTEEETGSRLGNLKARVDKLTVIWREIKPDIIVSFIRKNNLMAIASARPIKIPVIVSVRSAPARELKGRGFKEITFLIFRKAAGIVLQTTEAKEFFPPYLQRKAIVLPNSINPSFLKAKEELDLTTVTRKKNIIAVGRIDDNKNQKLLIEAFAPIASKYPDWNVDLYGDGDGRESLEKRVHELGLDNQVAFRGAVSDVPSRMKESSIFVLPSKIEGMPNALIEAMVMGMAVISTDCPCGGPRDLIIPYTQASTTADTRANGIIVPVDDIQAMTEALEILISSEELRTSLGAEATRLIDRLHPDIVNNMWREYIESKIKQ